MSTSTSVVNWLGSSHNQSRSGTGLNLFGPEEVEHLCLRTIA
jgi:hypothetical protein